MIKVVPSENIQRLPKQFFTGLYKDVNHYLDQGKDVIDIGIGNPDVPTPSFMLKDLQEAATKEKYGLYGPYRGDEELKKAVANFYLEHFGVELDSNKEVAVLHGTKAGIFEISQVLLNKGDTALLPDPFYPDFSSGLAYVDANIARVPLYEKDNYLVDYKRIDKSVASKAKVLFLNYPHNPTGASASKEFFDQTVEFANETQTLVIHDFAYWSMGFDNEKPLSFLQTSGAKEVGAEFFSLSKSHSVAGWRIGFIVGHEEIIEQINLLQDHTSVSLYSGIQEVARKALDKGYPPIEELRKVYDRRRSAFLSTLNTEHIHVFPSKASLYLWVKVPSNYTSEEFAFKILKDQYLAVAPGKGFGDEGEGYLRLSLCQPEDRLIQAAKRLNNVYESEL